MILRVTKKLFVDLAIWMIGLGLVIGACFPVLVVILGFDAKQVFTLTFWTATLGAGLIAGLLNYALASLVVRPRLQVLVAHMRIVEESIREATYNEAWNGCSASACRVQVDSRDEIGDCARAFNDLVEALFRSREVESAVSDFSKTLSSQLRLEDLSRQALELLLQHTGAVGGMVLIEKNAELKKSEKRRNEEI